MRNLLLCVLILLSGYCHLVSSVPSCDKPEGSCMCYFELEKSLLATERNVIQLSTTFFPLESNQPEFVTVKYTFDNSNVTQLMFWSVQTSHFLHPFEVFQFMSLFFSKPEPYYTGELTVQLYNNCSKLSSTDKNLQILTQRLKYYAERKSPILLRDSYSAKAYNEESLSALLEKNHGRITNIIICTAVFVVTLSFIVVIMALGYFFYTKSHSSSNWAVKVKKHYLAVFALTVLSFIANFYILCLAISAVGFWLKQGNNELRKLFHDFDEKRNLGPLFIALVIDIVCLITWIAIVAYVVAYYAVPKFKTLISEYRDKNATTLKCQRACKHRKQSACHCRDCVLCECVRCQHCLNIPCCRYVYSRVITDDTCILILSSTVLCPLFCIIAHSPYIAIAYLNDGSHASSIFIYYAILGYLLFGLLYLFLHWFENSTPMHKPLRFCTIIFLVIVIIVFLGLVVVISCYFVLIPINKAISDAPNRILSIYQSGGFVIGSIIVYEVLSHFHKKKKEESTIEYIKKIQEDVNILKNYQCQPAANTPHNGADAAQSGPDGDPRADTSIHQLHGNGTSEHQELSLEGTSVPQMPLSRGTTTTEPESTATEMHTTSTSELTPLTGGNHHY